MNCQQTQNKYLNQKCTLKINLCGLRWVDLPLAQTVQRNELLHDFYFIFINELGYFAEKDANVYSNNFQFRKHPRITLVFIIL